MVTKDTLIPRDETEILCEHITKANSTPPSSILDIGTGSGAIALFMKKKYPNANVSALDISKKALKVAKRNSVQYKLNLNLIESDLLSKKKAKEQFDIIIANLPYLPSDLNISPEVQEEPQCALFSGKDGLDHIKALKVELESKAIKFKQLWLEFLPQQSIEIKRIFKNYKCEFYKDLSGQCFFCKIQ